ncbi:DNA-binding protein [Paractinoplanes rishiriensis]|uniref:Uncharacterized protein n=1 Tax=Paractinoplanes rishiriensis TaxID=1050105 RepID=A0A919MV71_9ACTN|nr:DNA-binding protein [Actinoplanes rishiriensis]GIE93320.1 hypothetical protein Ari01nite_07850 [Actinoplanes rishiriensis]
MTGTPPGLPRLYTAAEVAEALRCSTWWVQEQVRQRRFPYEEIAGSCRFSAEHYAVILRVCEVLPAEELPTPVREVLPVLPGEALTGGLRPRVPRRLREVPTRTNAA